MKTFLTLGIVVFALCTCSTFGSNRKAQKTLSIRLNSVRYDITGLRCEATVKNLSKDTIFLDREVLFADVNLRLYQGQTLAFGGHDFINVTEYSPICDSLFLVHHFLMLLPDKSVTQEVHAYGEPFYSKLAQGGVYRVVFEYSFDKVYVERFSERIGFDILTCLPKVFVGSAQSNSLRFRATQTWGMWRRDE